MRNVTSKFVAAFGAIAMSAAVASAQTFVGQTFGCFYTTEVCDPTGSTTATVAGLTFTGSTFSVNGVDGTASLNTIDGNPGFAGNFGNFTLNPSQMNYEAQSFVLRIVVSQPATAAGSMMSDIQGGVNATGGSSVNVDFFNNAFFLLSPNQPISAQLNDLAVNAVGNNFVNGRLRTEQVVPEPSTYMLLGTGLAALGMVARRRRTNV